MVKVLVAAAFLSSSGVAYGQTSPASQPENPAQQAIHGRRQQLSQRPKLLLRTRQARPYSSRRLAKHLTFRRKWALRWRVQVISGHPQTSS